MSLQQLQEKSSQATRRHRVHRICPRVDVRQVRVRSRGQPAGQSRADNERSRQAIFRYDTFGDEQLWTDVRETPRRLADDSLRNSLHNLVG
jgi:hypothetical protein